MPRSYGDKLNTTLAECPSHLLFADDIILFSSAKQRAILKYNEVLKSYIKSSFRLMNASKCHYFLSASALHVRVRSVQATMEFNRSDIFQGTGCSWEETCAIFPVHHWPYRGTQTAGNLNFSWMREDWCWSSISYLQSWYIFCRLYPLAMLKEDQSYFGKFLLEVLVVWTEATLMLVEGLLPTCRGGRPRIA